MAPPNPAPNPEVEKAVQAVVSRLENNQGAEAVTSINKDYNDHRNDQTFTTAYSQLLSKQLTDKHLLPQLTVGLGWDKALPGSVDTNHDGRLSPIEMQQALGLGRKELLKPAEQIGLTFLDNNKVRLTLGHEKNSGGGDGNITAADVRAFAEKADRDKETRVSEMILKNPVAFRNFITNGEDREITEKDLAKKLASVNDALNSGDLSEKGRKNQEAWREGIEMVQSRIKEFSRQNTWDDTASTQQLVDWALRHREVPAYVAVAGGKGQSEAKPGYMADLICDYGIQHFGAIADAQNGNRISSSAIEKYLNTRRDSGQLGRQEEEILTQMKARFQDIQNLSKAPVEHEGFINFNDLNVYKRNQESARNAPDENMQTARKAQDFFRDQNGHFDFSGLSQNGKTLQLKDAQDLARDASRQLNLEKRLSLKGLSEAEKERQLAKVESLQDQVKIGEFLRDNWTELRNTKRSDGRGHPDSGVTADQLTNFLAHRGGALQYIDATGASSTPEAVAAAAKAEAAKQPPEAKPPEAKPPEAKPPEAKPPEAKPPEAKPPEAKPPEAKPPEAKPPEAKPPEAKPPEAKPPEAKPPEAKLPEKPPDENGLALRKLLGLRPDATEKEVSDTAAANNAAELRKLLKLPLDATDKQVSDKMAADNEAALKKLEQKQPAEPAKQPELGPQEKWEAGEQALKKQDWAVAEKLLRAAHTGFPIQNDTTDYVGNQIAVDLAKAILNNPENANKPEAGKEALGLLRQASKFYANHPEEQLIDPLRHDFIQKQLAPPPAKPVEAKPVEAKPVETKPVETKPVETKPVEAKPVEAKPVETKPVETKQPSPYDWPAEDQPKPKPAEDQPKPKPAEESKPKPEAEEKPKPAEPPEKLKAVEKPVDEWAKYIKDNITDKGGYSGADQYPAAAAEAARTDKKLVVVVGSRQEPGLLQGAANGVLRKDAVYIYADANTLDSSTPLGRLAEQAFPQGGTGSIAFDVHNSNDGYLHPQPWSRVSVEPQAQYKPETQPYYAPPQQYYAPQQQYYQQNCQPQRRGLLRRWR